MSNTPYTYLIGWTTHNKFYYGCRYAKDCHPDELMKTYFTSSKVVKEFIYKNGLPNVIQIRKTFTTNKKCKLWEYKVLRRLKVYYDPKFLNISMGGSALSGGKKRAEQTINKTWEEIYGVDKAQEMRLKSKIPKSQGMKKSWDSEAGIERKKKLSQRMKGNSFMGNKPKVMKTKISETFILKCEFCSTEKILRKIAANIKKKTCGSKICAANWSYKYNPDHKNRLKESRKFRCD